jgi:hypothetical protein
MDVQDAQLTLRCDRIKFTIQRKYGGFIISEELYEGPRLALRKELGIVYASHFEVTRAIDSLVRHSTTSSPDKTIEWTD